MHKIRIIRASKQGRYTKRPALGSGHESEWLKWEGRIRSLEKRRSRN